ncbi:MAG: acyltransferase [Mucilaginibacter sp.]|nr:acyltransferase [Mucilaginibacter sp.]
MKIEKLEAIRGFVAIYIVFHHIVSFYGLYNQNKALKLIFMHPQEAVMIFFLLSGFVIYVSTVNNKEITFYKYIKKRFVRIYPITVAAFLISTLIFFINGYDFTTVDAKNLIGNFLMMQDDKAQPGLIVPTYLDNFPLWSLSYEWWFYVMFFPLFVYFHKRIPANNIPHIYPILGISLIGWLLFLIWPNHAFLVITYFLLWWTGVACAEIYLKHQSFQLKTLMPVLLSISTMSLAIAIPVLKGYFVKHETLAQINAAYPISTYLHYYLDTLMFIIIGLIWWRFKLVGFNLFLRGFKVLAPISFAIYIIHFPFIWLNLPFIHNFYFLNLIKLILIIATAYLLEVKMQPLANKLFHNKIKPQKQELETQAF